MDVIALRTLIVNPNTALKLAYVNLNAKPSNNLATIH